MHDRPGQELPDILVIMRGDKKPISCPVSDSATQTVYLTAANDISGYIA